MLFICNTDFPMSFSAAAVAAWASSSIEYVNSSLFCCFSLLLFFAFFSWKFSNIISLLLILVCLLALLLYELWIEQLMWKNFAWMFFSCSFVNHRFVRFVAAGDGRKWNNNKSLNRSYLRCIIGLGFFIEKECSMRGWCCGKNWVNLIY